MTPPSDRAYGPSHAGAADASATPVRAGTDRAEEAS